MLTTPSALGTALNFLSYQLPQLHGLDDITGWTISCPLKNPILAALEDENLLGVHWIYFCSPCTWIAVLSRRLKQMTG
ncbi:hypothetical protein EV361DRAFT_940635 [Lentinula raphanica]|nr:hypothetical protein EV361DRAFT_940635 [Lentinula raphanica]